MKALVSILIPTYNRSHLLGQTLDSILAQTFKNWECIVVDDGSIDRTKELMEFYCEKDSRIQYYQRPRNRRKGANACRNYGFQLSEGKYIQWFDSDDLMVPQFLELKVKALEESEVDYVISKAANFRDPNPKDIISYNEQYYRFEEFEITNYNYVTQKMNWLTYDFLAKRELVTKVRFNEKLKSSQERNFFSKITLFSVNAKVINEYLTLRRIHDVSIQARHKVNRKLKQQEYLNFSIETWKEIAVLAPGSESELFFLFDLIKFNRRELPNLRIQIKVFFHLLKQGRPKIALSSFLYKYGYRLTGRFYFLRKLFLKSL